MPRVAMVAVLLSLSICGFLARAADWRLVWSDEFDYEGLPDPNKWAYEEGFVRNEELQYYTIARRENARVEDGVLIIEARRESWPNPKYDPNAPRRQWQLSRRQAQYTSASLTTKGKAQWTYGRIEVRAKLPFGRGVWPAIWTLGTNIDQVGWPACGEIDIMEYVGFEPNTIWANVHMAKYNHMLGTAKGSTIQIPRPYESFHVYALEWDKEQLRFFVDGKQYFQFNNEHTGIDVWPYDQPHYLLLNLAIGGTWGGQKGIDESIFPQRFVIDYVRVYQR
ncbi:MAG: glycoside hydrolase family 16 protein [Sedimentisphaerales bacterium]|nr:glycoside hydrolase family 16 protein [Sedimentisphaerales bacterium]